MKHLKLGACVINQTPLDWRGNLLRITQAITDAKANRVQILCLPELVVSGYGCEDAFQMSHVTEMAWSCLKEIEPLSKDLCLAIGLPILHRGALFNATAILVDGSLKALIAKRLLAGDGVHYEPRWFKPWPLGVQEFYEYEGDSVPIGDLYLEIGGIRLGLEICEEAWVANRPGANLARKGVDVILNPSASHFAFGKKDVRQRFVSEGSRAFQVAYVYSNLLGNESGRIIFDGGSLIASAGEVVAMGPRFSYRDHELTTAVVDIDVNRMLKSRSGSFQPLLGERDDECVEVDFSWKYNADEKVSHLSKKDQAVWEYSDSLKSEEFARAVSLGLFDYLRKSKLQGFTISLSGGVDSAVCALLSTLSLTLAEKQLGLEGLKRRLAHIGSLSTAIDMKSICKQLVTTVYQATANSSVQTKEAAKSMAESLGVEHHEWNVESLVESYRNLVASTQPSGFKWDWSKHDLTLQNIQARVRSPSVWMLANLKGQLLLATSNRSEAAVGYATMDGDTSGGLSPLSGIDKAFLRSWCEWVVSDPKAMMDVSREMFKGLEMVLSQPPKAELRPASDAQTDESDLMPYDVLDAIERAAIRDKKSPEECLSRVVSEFSQYSAQKLSEWVARFFTLWCLNQWKRERYAPGFHLDDVSLDPKTWCRFPILSSGFEAELAELKRNNRS
jgi:NAD+ synthase (glutamine-hydrolysing)